MQNMRIGVFFLSFSVILLAQNGDKKETNYSARFRCLAFDESLSDIGYMEGKEFRPLVIDQHFIATEVSYKGKPEIDFIRLITAKTEPTELEIINQKRDQSSKNLEKTGEEYNKLVAKLDAVCLPATIQERELNSNERVIISEINSEMELLAKKMSSEAAELGESNAKYLSRLSQKGYQKIDNNKSVQAKKEIPSAPLYEPFAKFPIPASGGSYILIFNKTPNGVTISPINDAPGVFPFGSYQFFNLAGTPVELRFGSKVISLSPNGRTVFKPEIANGEYLEGEFWTKVDDEFKLGYKFRNLHISRVRTLAFIMPTAPGQSALNLKIAEERGQIEPPPAEKPKSKDKKDKDSEKKENENRPFG